MDTAGVVHFSHYCPQHNSKTNDPKVFKLGIGNELGMTYMWYGFGVERSRLGGLGLTIVCVGLNSMSAF